MEKAARTDQQTLIDRMKAYIKPIVFGLLASAAIVLLLLLLFAVALPMLGMTQAAVPWLVRLTSVVAGFVAGFISARCRRKRGLLIGGATAAVLGCCVLIAGFFVSGVFALMRAVTKLLLYAVAGMVGGFLGVGSGKKRR